MDTELRKMLKNEFGNNVFRLMNFFWKKYGKFNENIEI